MTETPELSIYEKAFAKSDKTDAILVVDGKKLHVNKAVLSYHSDYFESLFNSDFKKESMEEIKIEDANFENFASLLSLVHNAPIECPTHLLDFFQLENRFKLPAAKRHLELLLIASSSDRENLIKTADKYGLNEAMSRALSLFKRKQDFNLYGTPKSWLFNNLSMETRMKLFNRALEIEKKLVVSKKAVESPMSICEKVFSKSDKTDAVLVVDGKKLHVNKAILSYHSDYFNALFNSEFKEKSMEEIPIEDVNFVDFATLLSFFHLNPIKPTKENAEKIIELGDQFAYPFIKYYLERLLTSAGFDEFEMIRIGEKHEMKELIKNAVNRLKSEQFTNVTSNPTFQSFSDKTKSEIFYKFLKL